MFRFLAGYVKTQKETITHKIRVLSNMIKLTNKLEHPNKWQLYWRGCKHDWSKLGWYEAKYYAKIIFLLKGSTYGSDDYKKNLEGIQPAVKHHYKKNSHHPEYYKNGIQDMTELDKLELVADWAAAIKRHKDGDIYKSIKINQKRFGYDNEFKEWLISMVKIIE